ncbi:AraC family transcriptional regulator [Hahella sp. SMD15-11]|uniref:AraC family transcriptional regulator n=1 Tax=Thermohahella caldifontis TaxID=3142973 RepID=A0AB39UYW8_9GAMM
MELGDISVSFVLTMQRAVLALGHDPEPVLARYGLDREKRAQPGFRLSIPRFMRIGHDLMTLTGRPDIGLITGRITHWSDLGPVGLAAMSAPTLGQAMRVAINFERLGSKNRKGHSHYSEENGRGLARFYSLTPYNDYNRFVVDCILASWYQLALTATGETDLVHHAEIEFERPDYADRYAEHLPFPIRFGAKRNAVVFRRRATQWPLCTHNPAVHNLSVQWCHEELNKLDRESAYRERVAKAALSRFNGGPPRLEEIAEQLGMSPWTLRRRLADEGITYQEIVDAVRKDLAETYVKSTDLTMSEIAYRLGFASPPAFFRAFRRWFGLTPKLYRSQRQPH